MGSPSFFSLLFCFYIFARPHISNCRTYEIYVTCVIDPEGRPGLIGVIRSKLLPSTRIFIHIRPSILDPDLRPDRPGNYVTMLQLFVSMLGNGLCPNEFALASALGACCQSAVANARLGLSVHGLAVKAGLDANPYVGSSLMLMYA